MITEEKKGQAMDDNNHPLILQSPKPPLKDPSASLKIILSFTNQILHKTAKKQSYYKTFLYQETGDSKASLQP